MADEFSVLTRARLNGRHADEAALEWAINIYEAERNPAGNTINWRFYTQDAKTKLDRLHPFNMRANSSALIFRLVWQSSLATLPFRALRAPVPRLWHRREPSQGAKNGRLVPEVCHW